MWEVGAASLYHRPCLHLTCYTSGIISGCLSFCDVMIDPWVQSQQADFIPYKGLYQPLIHCVEQPSCLCPLSHWCISSSAAVTKYHKLG